jgi:hypothetical protein
MPQHVGGDINFLIFGEMGIGLGGNTEDDTIRFTARELAAGTRQKEGRGANRAMTSFTSLGSSADCRGLIQVIRYQGQTNNARTVAFLVSQRGLSLG